MNANTNIIDLLKENIENQNDFSDALKSAIEYLKKEPLEKLLFAKSESYVTPFAVIAVSNSAKHIDAVCTNIIKTLKEQSLFNTKIRIDGNGERGWCILDVSDCLINIITEEKFKKYAIDEIIKGNFTDIEDFS